MLGNLKELELGILHESSVLPELPEPPIRDVVNLFATLYNLGGPQANSRGTDLCFAFGISISSWLQSLSTIAIISPSEIDRRLVKDNVKIAELLQQLFELDSYKTNIPTLPQEYAGAAMNLTNNVSESWSIFIHE